MRNRRTLAFIALLSLATSGAFAGTVSLLDPASVVASQGDVSVTLADVDALAATIPAHDRAQVFSSGKRIERAIIGLLLQKQLVAQAQAHGLDKTLDKGTLTPYEVERRLAAAEQQHFIANLKVPDMDQLARETYIADRDAYSVPTPLVVEQVLVSTTQRSEAQALAIAEKVEAESRKDPNGFQALVETYSDAPDKAETKGRIALVDSQDPTLFKAALALNTPGEISTIAKTADGLSVLKLIERGPAKAKPFEEVQPKLVASLKGKWIKERAQRRVDELRNQVLDANPDLVAALRTRYVDAAAEAPAAAAPGWGR